MNENIARFAIENGYSGAEFLQIWHGYNVYQPMFDGTEPGEVVSVGLPLVILEKNGKIRMSTPEECMQI